MSASSKLRRLVFGAGYTGSRVARSAVRRGDEVIATVRSEARARTLEGQGFVVTRAPVTEVAARYVTEDTHVIIGFPPDGVTDAALAPHLRGAKAISYISSTGVYGDTHGVLDDTTAVPDALPGLLPGRATESARRILEAEACYRAVGATVLRAPGIYGPDRGLHVRVTSGQHRIPGDGAGFMSRIHADDLAELLLASVAVRGETFVVADLEPARQCDLVAWICEEYGCAMPPSVPPNEVHETLRRDRRVDGSRALRELGVTLRYPSFRVGMKRTAGER
jgi:nucleoside-diphosphate-sugar epimerase